MNTKLIRILAVSLPASLILLMSGCVKTHEGFTDFSTTSDFVILTGAGTGNVKASNVAITGDTVRKTITVNLASKNNDNGPVTVTLGVDAAALAAYNTANGKNYQPFPAGSYKLTSSTVTVPAGQHYGTTTLEIYKSKLDPSKDYMLPISITDGGGKQLSSNQNTIYFNIIGNPIAGSYELYFSRWLKADTTGGATTANEYKDDQGAVTFAPTSATQVQTDGAFGETVIIDFTNSSGTLSNFKVSNPAGTAAAIGVSSWGPPSFVVADPVHGYYKVIQQYPNASGLTRTVVYEYIKK
jgi:hypothetical protein